MKTYQARKKHEQNIGPHGATDNDSDSMVWEIKKSARQMKLRKVMMKIVILKTIVYSWTDEVVKKVFMDYW